MSDRTDPNQADVLVSFGITGDLARVMTFHSLYRLERRGLLACPIVGVAADHWSTDDLRKHAADAIEAAGENIDTDVLDRLSARMTYLPGDFTDPTPTATSPPRWPGRPTRCSTCRPHRRCSGRWSGPRRGRPHPDRAGGGGEAVRARPGLGPRARGGAAPVRGRAAAVPHRPLPGQARPGGTALPTVRQHDPGAGVEPAPHRVGPDHDGRELRRRGPGPLLRRGRRAARRVRQPPDAAAVGGRDGTAGRARPGTIKNYQVQLWRAVADAPTLPITCAASTTATAASTASSRIRHRDVRGVPAGHRQLAMVGRPFFIRTGKRMPVPRPSSV